MDDRLRPKRSSHTKLRTAGRLTVCPGPGTRTRRRPSGTRTAPDDPKGKHKQKRQDKRKSLRTVSPRFQLTLISAEQFPDCLRRTLGKKSTPPPPHTTSEMMAADLVLCCQVPVPADWHRCKSHHVQTRHDKANPFLAPDSVSLLIGFFSSPRI